MFMLIWTKYRILIASTANVFDSCYYSEEEGNSLEDMSRSPNVPNENESNKAV